MRANYIKAQIEKEQQKSWCRLNSDKDETINHIISECNKLAQNEYQTRQDLIGRMIHREFCKMFKFDQMNTWSLHYPESTLENN